jgi:hypothetical protein
MRIIQARPGLLYFFHNVKFTFQLLHANTTDGCEQVHISALNVAARALCKACDGLR